MPPKRFRSFLPLRTVPRRASPGIVVCAWVPLARAGEVVLRPRSERRTRCYHSLLECWAVPAQRWLRSGVLDRQLEKTKFWLMLLWRVGEVSSHPE